MKKIFLLLALSIVFIGLNAQIGKLPYKKVIQAYRGDTLYSEFDGDSVRLVTNKKWAFNPAISGGETLGNPSASGMLLKSTTDGVRSWGWPAYVRNYNLTDTFSVLRTVPTGMIGNYTRSVSGYHSQIDSFTSGSSYLYCKNNYGNLAFLIQNKSGATAYFTGENYGINMSVGANKENSIVLNVGGNYTGGKVIRVTNNLADAYLEYIDLNYGYDQYVNINYSGAYSWYVNTNFGYAGYVKTNNNYTYYTDQNVYSYSNSGYVYNNNGYAWRVFSNNINAHSVYVDYNYNGAYHNTVNSNSGICNTVKNKKSTTGGVHTIISAQVYYDNIQKWYRDSIGLSHGEIPSATGFDTTVNLSVTLTENVWQKVTNSTNNLWSMITEGVSYMSFSNDSIINTYAGMYEYSFFLNVNGKDGATYEYRVRKKSGTTVSTLFSMRITGGGVNVPRTVTCMPLLAAGDKVWLEVRFIGSPTGSPISIFGSYFTAKAVYLSL